MKALFDRVCRNPETGEVVVAQPPNLPLGVFLVAALVRAGLQLADVGGVAHTVADVVATGALVVWAVLEVGWGDSLFRRLLGAAVLAGVIVGRLVL